MISTRKGFTLIEMVIVIAVVGILASMVLVGVAPVRRQGRDARRISDLRQVQTGLELYFVRNGEYPDTQSWSELVNTLVGASIGISNVPQDPSPNKTYQYASDFTSYVIAAELEETGNTRLNEDVDGTILGVDCGAAGSDTVYCVQL